VPHTSNKSRAGESDLSGLFRILPLTSDQEREYSLTMNGVRLTMCTMQITVCSPRSFTASLTMAVLLVCGAAALCTAAERPDGAELYQKHCVSCHPDGSKLKLDIPLLGTLRTPPVGMPAFGPEKLTDRDVQAIGEYLRPGAPAAPKTEPAPQAPAKAGKSSKEKKSWMKGFGTAD